MSSGPVGLDAREYGYAFFKYAPPDANPHTIATHKQWLITKIQAFADPAHDLLLTLEGSAIDIAAGGCFTLEPNGAYRGDVIVQAGGGTTGLVVIEYWFAPTPNGVAPAPTVS